MKKQRALKALASLLIFSLCISILPSFVFAVSEDKTANDTAPTHEDFLVGNATAEDIYGVLDESTVPEIVGYEEAVRKNHVQRLYEDEGEDLNKIVFLNVDGSKTMYLFDFPVKYINEAGSIQDIRLEIVNNASKMGEFQTAANDVVTTFPEKFTDGISLKGNETEILLAPVLPTANSDKVQVANRITTNMVANSTAQRVDKNTVEYQYDSKTTVEYSLTYTGFKEDIVVSEYTGQTEYPFRLYTNGLTLEEIDGSYFLVDENGDIQATIGDIIIFTADERNNAFGSIVPTTIVEDEEYLLTIVVNADYLADPNTAYPIRIDPTIEINYNDSGASAIEDITISTNTNFAGSHTSLYVGRRSAEGIPRTLIRFPGLDLDGFSRAAILNASLRVHDLICEGEQMNIYCHAFTGNVWDANSATWSSVSPDSYSASPIDTVAMSWPIGDGLNPVHWYTFDITEAVRGWTDSTYAQDKGLMLKMDSFTENGSTIKNRTFGSYNRASYKPSLSVTYTDGTGGGDSFTEATTISLASSRYITTTITQEQRYFKFIPTETAEYVIMSNNYTGDPKLWLYNSGYSQITSQDDVSYPSNKNFWLKYTLQAGNTYYIGAGHASSHVGGYYLMILRSAELANGFYHVRNQYSEKRLDVCGPGEQIYVHQWTAHTGEQEKWLIQGYVENGKIAYYTIRSQFGANKYIGVSNTNIGENNIQLFDDIGNNTKWNIYSTPSGSYFLEPIAAKGRGIYAADTGTGTKMQLSWAIPDSTKTKWFMDVYTYSDVNFTFSAFDMGDSSQDEAALVNSKFAGYGYTSIGTYNNKSKYIPLESPIDVGRYSDIIYINSHGGRGAYMWHQTYNGDTATKDGYICADARFTEQDGLPIAEVGAQFKSGSSTITNSKWNQRTKWAIFGGCHQLSYQSNSMEGSVQGSWYNADWWGATMLGDGVRMHGILGYYKGAPPADVSYDRLNNFLTYANNRTILNAWRDAHSQLLDASTNWAMIYHGANAGDTIYNYTDSTPTGSAYNIYIVMRERAQQIMYSIGPSVPYDTNGLIANEMPVFIDSVDRIAVNNIYSNLREKLCLSEYDNLVIDQNDKISYTNSISRMGEDNLGMSITEDEAVKIALRMLKDLGLSPTGEYRATVSTINRYRMDLTGKNVEAPETIEYTVSIYRIVNGLDFVSDQEDGIVISFDKYGLTTLHYKWRNTTTSVQQVAATRNAITEQQARNTYKEQMAQSGIDLSDDEIIVRKAYVQDDQIVRTVWVCSYDYGYGNHIFVDCNSGEIITI